MIHTKCARWSAVGGLLGAATAYAQAPTEAAVAVASDPLATVLVELARVSPLTALAAWLAFSAARWQPTIRIVLVEDESKLKERLDALERRVGP